MDTVNKDDELVIEDDDRYVMASPGIMVAHDRKALQDYYKNAEQNRRKQNELNTLRNDVAGLSSEVSELKQLILQMHAKLEDKD